MDFITVFRRERRYIYLITALWISACVCLLFAVRDLDWYSLLFALLAVGAVVVMLFAMRKRRENAADPTVDGSQEGILQKLYDRVQGIQYGVLPDPHGWCHEVK